MQRTAERALRSRGWAGGGGGTVTTAGCSVGSPEIAILTQGLQALGTFISPDFQGAGRSSQEQGGGALGQMRNPPPPLELPVPGPRSTRDGWEEEP